MHIWSTKVFEVNIFVIHKALLKFMKIFSWKFGAIWYIVGILQVNLCTNHGNFEAEKSVYVVSTISQEIFQVS